MKDVQEVLEKRIDGAHAEVDFKELSKRWACYSLENTEGPLLEKGLAISKALVEYHFELLGEK